MNLCFFGLYTMSPFSVQFPPTLLITQACVEESSACRFCTGLSTQALLPRPPPPPPASVHAPALQASLSQGLLLPRQIPSFIFL